MEKVIVEKIVRGCPKAFADLIEWFKLKGDFLNHPLLEETSIEPLQKMIMINSVPRYLYDFFDHHNIFIKIYPITPSETWGWCVQNQHLISLEEGIGGPNRINAENCAFEGAFAILESKL